MTSVDIGLDIGLDFKIVKIQRKYMTKLYNGDCIEVMKSYKNKIYYYEKTEFQRMATRT